MFKPVFLHYLCMTNLLIWHFAADQIASCDYLGRDNPINLSRDLFIRILHNCLTQSNYEFSILHYSFYIRYVDIFN
jgi:hypothetical protein